MGKKKNNQKNININDIQEHEIVELGSSEKSSITISRAKDWNINFGAVFKIYSKYLFGNISSILIVLIFPIIFLVTGAMILSYSRAMLFVFLPILLVPLIFIPSTLIDFRSSSIIKRIGSTNITKGTFNLYITIINFIIISFLAMFFLFILLPSLAMLPGGTRNSISRVGVMWNKIAWFQVIILFTITSLLFIQFGIFLGMKSSNRILSIFIGIGFVFIFMWTSGMLFGSWQERIVLGYEGIGTWVYATSPFSLTLSSLNNAIIGQTSLRTFIIGSLTGIAFILLFIVTQDYWLSFGGIR